MYMEYSVQIYHTIISFLDFAQIKRNINKQILSPEIIKIYGSKFAEDLCKEYDISTLIFWHEQHNFRCNENHLIKLIEQSAKRKKEKAFLQFWKKYQYPIFPIFYDTAAKSGSFIFAEYFFT